MISQLDKSLALEDHKDGPRPHHAYALAVGVLLRYAEEATDADVLSTLYGAIIHYENLDYRKAALKFEELADRLRATPATLQPLLISAARTAATALYAANRAAVSDGCYT
jgi:hypothetical protein